MKRLEFLNPDATHEYCALILTGMHGNETTPLWCGITLNSMLSQMPAERFRKIVIIQGANESGLLAAQREVQRGNFADLNRCWNDQTNIRKLIEEEMNEADLVIDVHSSPNLEPCFLVDIDRYANLVQEVLSSISDVRIAFRHSGIDSVKRYTLEHNKVGLTLELNKICEIDSASARLGALWIVKLLRNFTMPDFESVNSAMTIMIQVPPYIEMKSPESGIFQPLVHNGQAVQKGSTIGNVLDLDGRTIFTITSETNGWVVGVEPFTYIGRGHPIVMVQPA